MNGERERGEATTRKEQVLADNKKVVVVYCVKFRSCMEGKNIY